MNVFLLIFFAVSILLNCGECGKPQPSANKLQSLKQSLSMKKVAVKAAMLAYRDKHGLRGLLLAAIASKDIPSVRLILKMIKAKQWDTYAQKCMERFHSEPLCFSDTVSFYIWQQIEVQRMRRQMLGPNWKFSDKVSTREINRLSKEKKLSK